MSGVLGTSHLCIAYDDALQPVFPPKPNAYAVKFLEADLLNPDQKRPFLRYWAPRHSMAFLTAPEGISLEMLPCHRGPAEAPFGYQPILPVEDKVFRAFQADPHGCFEPVSAMLGQEVRSAILGGVNALTVPADAAAGIRDGLHAVALGCSDIERSATFWTQGLGLKKVPSVGSGRWLQLRSLSRSWDLTLLLYPLPSGTRRMYLDDAGCNCLSFLTRGHENWRAQRMQHGASEHGESFVIAVGGRQVQVAFLRGPDGELVELLNYV